VAIYHSRLRRSEDAHVYIVISVRKPTATISSITHLKIADHKIYIFKVILIY